MRVADEMCDEQLERWRRYLAMLARCRVAPQLRSKIDESDVVQQTLLEAHQSRHEFRGSTDSEYAAWLRQILAHNLSNLVRDYCREKRDITRERRLYLDDDSVVARAEELAANQTSIIGRVDRLAQAVRLADVLSRLPAEQRAAVELRHLEGRPLNEIAAHLERSTSAVAGLLYRALKELRRQLDNAGT